MGQGSVGRGPASSEMNQNYFSSSDLQNNVTKKAEDPSGAQGSCGQCSSADVALCGILDQKGGVGRTERLRDPPSNEPSSACVEEGLFLPLGEPPCGRGMLQEFLHRATSQWEPPLAAHWSPAEEDAAHVSRSEEEYEEDIIEPRMLNEITAMTDKTSPWSSLVSESEQDPDQGAVNTRKAEPLPGAPGHLPNVGSVRSSLLSSEAQDGPLSMPSTVRSSNSPFGGGREREEGVRGQALGGGSEELLQAPSASVADQEGGRPVEAPETGQEGAVGVQGRGAGGEPFPWSEGGGLAVAAAAAAEVEEPSEGLHGKAPGEEGHTKEESHPRCSRWSDAAQSPEGCSSGSDESPPEGSDKPLPPSVVLYPFALRSPNGGSKSSVNRSRSLPSP